MTPWLNVLFFLSHVAAATPAATSDLFVSDECTRPGMKRSTPGGGGNGSEKVAAKRAKSASTASTTVAYQVKYSLKGSITEWGEHTFDDCNGEEYADALRDHKKKVRRYNVKGPKAPTIYLQLASANDAARDKFRSLVKPLHLSGRDGRNGHDSDDETMRMNTKTNRPKMREKRHMQNTQSLPPPLWQGNTNTPLIFMEWWTRMTLICRTSARTGCELKSLPDAWSEAASSLDCHRRLTALLFVFFEREERELDKEARLVRVYPCFTNNSNNPSTLQEVSAVSS